MGWRLNSVGWWLVWAIGAALMFFHGIDTVLLIAFSLMLLGVYGQFRLAVERVNERLLAAIREYDLTLDGWELRQAALWVVGEKAARAANKRVED